MNGAEALAYAPKPEERLVRHYLMPAAVQALDTALMQRSEALIHLSLITVACMLAAVTHFGISSTEATSVFVSSSLVVPLSRPAGGFSPARR